MRPIEKQGQEATGGTFEDLKNLARNNGRIAFQYSNGQYGSIERDGCDIYRGTLGEVIAWEKGYNPAGTGKPCRKRRRRADPKKAQPQQQKAQPQQPRPARKKRELTEAEKKEAAAYWQAFQKRKIEEIAAHMRKRNL